MHWRLSVSAMASSINRILCSWIYLLSFLLAIALCNCVVEHSFAAELPAEASPTIALSDGAKQAEVSKESEVDAIATVEQIEDNKNPSSAGVTSTWSLIDLFCAIVTMSLCIGLLANISQRRINGIVQPSRTLLGAASTIPAIVAVFAIAFTQDFAMPMSIFDELSIFFSVLLIANLVLVILATIKQRDDHNDTGHNNTDIANAPA